MAPLTIFRTFPLATRLAAVVVLPLLVAGIWFLASVDASLPSEGSLRLTEGVSTSTTIERDAGGVAHIRSGSDADAFFAVGYAHAQDRLWQLELQRRIGRGRLSEVFGKESVDSDVWFRTLGLYESTKTAWPLLSPQAQLSLTAYTAGINAWLSEGHPLPIEFRTFGVVPEPWTQRDSLAWAKVFALNLGGNFRREVSRYAVSDVLTPTQLSAFFPAYPADGPTTLAAKDTHLPENLTALSAFQQKLERELGLAALHTGSNAWAVSGRHTDDGSALLANDPHLSLQIPSLWYAISIDAPTLKVSGASLVGLPLVIFGRNDRIAWGGTNMMADAQDLFLERPDPDGRHYEAGTELRPFSIRNETIHVRADFPGQFRKPYAPVLLRVRTSHHGPVISDRLGVFNQPVSLRWTALDADDTSYEAFFRMNHARDWDSFKAALSHHVAPAMNLVYADRDGNIGYLGAGRIPIRRRGEGTLPSPGWDTSYGWSGYVHPSEWPQVFNPPSGYIVNANNKIVGADYPHFISHDWASPARARRIEQLLGERIDARQPLRIVDMQRIQADTVDLEAADLLPQLRARSPAGERGARAAVYLKNWNGDMRADSQAAAIFHAWMRHFRLALFNDDDNARWDEQPQQELLASLQRNVSLDFLHSQLEADNSPWCDDQATARQENCDAMLVASQKAALLELYKLKGDWSMESWQWGQIQSTFYAHAPFSRWAPLARLFERRIGNGGSQNTINVADSEFAGSEGYLQSFGAGFRQIISLSPGGITHYYMGSTGQSGNVASRHYDDMVVPFRDVHYRSMDSTFDRPDSSTLRTAAGSGRDPEEAR